ncbi:efflux RND transporter permease subunit [Salisaeta longa]|uniref:efflux RND transporter permease subunit n=1 Tax=Salisaeta longa TaxID=503170 RepID=UPI0003B729E2|nr:efflux RND transporter permease subunit [Salisaeta longa]
MNRAIEWFARNGVAANLLMVLLLFGGGIAASTTVQEVFPEYALDAIQIQVAYPGGSPEEVEDAIVQRIEDRIQGVEGIDRIVSVATENAGVVTAELKQGTNVQNALNDIKQEVDRITSFPPQAEEPVVAQLENRQQALQLALYGNASKRVLKELAQQAKDELTLKPEISLVQIGGVRSYEISIEVPRERLRAYGLTLAEVAALVRQGSLDLPGGSVETSEQTVTIQTEGENYTQRDFENIVIRAQPDGTKLRLGDIATVVDGFDQNADLITRFNGQPAVLLNIFQVGDEQVLAIEEVVKQYLDGELQRTMPAGIEAAIWQNNASDLRSRLSLLIENGLLGLLLVIVALTLFLEPRLAFWSSVGILLSFIGAFAIMQFVGISINLLSLFGFILAIGIVVDDAIVVSENIFAEQERGRSPLQAAIQGAKRVSIPVVFAVLTTVAAFAPLLFVAGTIGKFLSDIPAIVIIVLALSLLEALLILPHHLSLVDRTQKPRNMVAQGLERARTWVGARLRLFVTGPLKHALRFATRRYGLTLSGGLALLIVAFSFVANGYIPFQFFPAIQGKLVSAQLEMPAGTTPEETARVAEQLRRTGYAAIHQLERQAGVPRGSLIDNLYVTVGRQPRANSGPNSAGFTATKANVAEVSFEMIDPERRDVTSSQFEEAWRKATGAVPGVRSLVFTANVVQIGEPVSAELSAGTPEQLERAVRAVQDSLGRFTGVFDIKSDRAQGQREVNLRLKPAARTLGLTLNTLAQQVRAGFFGVESYRLQRGRDEVRVYVRLPDHQRNAIEDLYQYRIQAPNGAQVPLEEVAHASLGYAPTQINRQDGRRVITITADVNAAIVTGQEVTATLESRILPNIKEQIPGLTFQFGGQQRQQRKAQQSLLIGFALAIFAIYALLAIPMRSYLQPLVIMSTIPFAWIGAIIGHLVLGISLGLLSIFGIVGLSGVIVNDALVMLDFANEERAKGTDWVDAVVRAGQVRFRPILLTSLTTFLGVFPIIIEQSVQAQFLIPMAVSLGLGILFGTAVLMMIVPALAVFQRDAVAWVQTRLLGYDVPSISYGPYSASEAP